MWYITICKKNQSLTICKKNRWLPAIKEQIFNIYIYTHLKKQYDPEIIYFFIFVIIKIRFFFYFI